MFTTELLHHGEPVKDYIRHPYNSQRFRCAVCNRLYEWGFRKVLVCDCGYVHWKPPLNFRGEGPEIFKHWRHTYPPEEFFEEMKKRGQVK